MFKKIARCALSGVLALSLCPIAAYAANPPKAWAGDIDAMLAAGGYIEGQAIVGIDTGVEEQFDLMRVLFGSPLDGAADLAEVDASALVGVARPAGEVVRLAVVSDPSISTEQLLRKLVDERSVVFAEPNYAIGLAVDDSEEGRSSAMGEADVLAPDNYTYLQWAFDGEKGCNPPAWNTSSGNMGAAPVIVAVLDSGIDQDHPDLQGSMYRFSAEQKAQLGCGDYGYDALAGGGSFTGDPLGHGTQVAGTIAAQWNSFGVSGIASNADLVSVRVVGESGTDSMASVLRGYQFVKDAVEAGVPVSVVNNSWASSASSRAVDALSRDLGANESVLSVFAAGNAAANLDEAATASARNPYAFKVAASDADGALWSGSSYGAEQVSFGAPGASILSTTSSMSESAATDGSYVTDGKGAYDTVSGTSLAAAVTTGAAALLASDYRTASGKLPTAIELAHRVSSHVRYEPSFAGLVRGNGVLDLSMVPQSLDVQATGAPSISGVSLDDDEVTVKGANFGATQGPDSSLEVHKGGLGDDNAAVAYDKSSVIWSDEEISFMLDDEPTGIIDVVVSTGVGDPARGSVFASAEEAVYEESLELPEKVLPASGATLASDGILKGWGRYLYYLPETKTADGSAFVYHDLMRYDIDADRWTKLASPDEWLVYCSAVMFGGNLVVAGVVCDEESGEPSTVENVYMYDIENDEWETLESEGVNLGASVTNLNDMLVFVGGADSSWNLSEEVVLYDTGAGVVAPLATLATPVFNPQLAVHHNASLSDSEGQIYVYSFGDTYGEFTGTKAAAQHLQVISDDDVEEIGKAFPSFLATDAVEGMPARASLFGSLAAANEGLMLVGPAAADGTTDTYLFDWTEAKAFLPFYKRASDAQLYGSAACLHDNYLYAAAQSEVEPSHGVFRATELLAPIVGEGNDQVWRKGSKKGLSIAYTPDLSRYYDDVYIDDEEVEGDALDVEFYAYDAGKKDNVGSTIITLTPEYLETLSVGKHTETVCFDGKNDSGIGATVTAKFRIEKKADPMPPTPDPDPSPSPDPNRGNGSATNGQFGQGGSFDVDDDDDDGPSSTRGASSVRPTASGVTKPAALAMTGDTMLAVPFIVLGLGAVGLGVYLIRRRLHNR